MTRPRVDVGRRARGRAGGGHRRGDAGRGEPAPRLGPRRRGRRPRGGGRARGREQQRALVGATRSIRSRATRSSTAFRCESRRRSAGGGRRVRVIDADGHVLEPRVGLRASPRRPAAAHRDRRARPRSRAGRRTKRSSSAASACSARRARWSPTSRTRSRSRRRSPARSIRTPASPTSTSRASTPWCCIPTVGLAYWAIADPRRRGRGGARVQRLARDVLRRRPHPAVRRRRAPVPGSADRRRRSCGARTTSSGSAPRSCDRIRARVARSSTPRTRSCGRRPRSSTSPSASTRARRWRSRPSGSTARRTTRSCSTRRRTRSST